MLESFTKLVELCSFVSPAIVFAFWRDGLPDSRKSLRFLIVSYMRFFKLERFVDAGIGFECCSLSPNSLASIISYERVP